MDWNWENKQKYVLFKNEFRKVSILFQNLLHNYDRGRRTEEIERERDVKKIRDLQRAMQVSFHGFKVLIIYYNVFICTDNNNLYKDILYHYLT